MGASPIGGPAGYAEDRVGVTAMIWACVAAPAVVQLVLCLTTPWPFWVPATGVTGSLEVFALTLLHQCWETGIRVTADAVSIGGCRRFERLAAKGRRPKAVIDPHFRLRNRFSAPIAAIHSARVLRRAEFDAIEPWVITPAGRGKPVKRRSFVNLVSPLASAAMVLEVDLEHADMPAMAGYMVERGELTRTSRVYVLTNRWTVATRHPDELRDALQQVGVPVLGR